MEEDITILIINTVHAKNLAQLGAMASANTEMTQLAYTYIRDQHSNGCCILYVYGICQIT